MTTIFTKDRGLPARMLMADILSPGALAGPWRIEHELGRGGMGTVYAVVHEGIGKRAALKVVHRRLLTEDRTIERVLLEARAVNQVRHPNIVDIFETGMLADGRPYIVMERLDGVPLSVRVTQTKLRADEVIAILLQICDALGAAHGAGVVHRDLKLDNVFMANDGSVKVLDWGIAKIVTTDCKHTLDGELVGTPQYVSPEQARGAAVTPQSDVYSLGVVAYELFLEQLPFEAETAAEILVMHLHAAPPPPRDAWPDIPDELEALLLAMLHKDGAKRPTMAGVAEALGVIRGELERRRGFFAAASMETISIPRPRKASSAELALTAASTTARGPSPGRRWPVTLAVAGVVAAIVLVVAGYQGGGTNAQAAVVDAVATPVVRPIEILVPELVATPVPVVAPIVAPAKPVPHRLAPKAPHKANHRDPNGTVDPYR